MVGSFASSKWADPFQLQSKTPPQHLVQLICQSHTTLCFSSSSRIHRQTSKVPCYFSSSGHWNTDRPVHAHFLELSSILWTIVLTRAPPRGGPLLALYHGLCPCVARSSVLLRGPLLVWVLFIAHAVCRDRTLTFTSDHVSSLSNRAFVVVEDFDKTDAAESLLPPCLFVLGHSKHMTTCFWYIYTFANPSVRPRIVQTSWTTLSGSNLLGLPVVLSQVVLLSLIFLPTEIVLLPQIVLRSTINDRTVPCRIRQGKHSI